MELGRCDHLSELLHVVRLDVDNVETLVRDVEIPQVDAQIIRRDEGLAVAIDGDRVDVVRVRVGVHAPCCVRENALVGLKLGQAHMGLATLRRIWLQVGARHHLDLTLMNLPQLDRLVCE